MIVEHRTYTSSKAYFIPSSLRSCYLLLLLPQFMLEYVDVQVSWYQQPPTVEKV
jgi:hypothetical protein